MMFYNYHSLGDAASMTPHGFRGCLSAPTVEEVSTILKSNIHTKGYADTVAKVYFQVTFTNDTSRAYIQLMIMLANTRIQCLSSCYLNTVEYNCGVLHISNLSTMIPRVGFGKMLLKEIIHWMDHAGYTLLIGNTAGKWQNLQAGGFFRSQGFKPFGRKYKNKRSGNTNVWFALHI